MVKILLLFPLLIVTTYPATGTHIHPSFRRRDTEQEVCNNVVELGTIPNTGINVTSTFTIVGASSVYDGLDACSSRIDTSLSTVWYQIDGTGESCRATAYSETGVRVSAYQGTCQTPRCANGQSDRHSFSTSWTTNAGSHCFAAVFLNEPQNSYTLHIEPLVDACSQVTDLGQLPETGSITQQDEFTSPLQYYLELETCSYYEDSHDPLLLFKIIGSQDLFVASVSSQELSLSVSAYRGDDCGHNLQCAPGQSESHMESTSWTAFANGSYFVAVKLRSHQAGGTFTLNVSRLRIGNACDDVVPLGPIDDDGLVEVGSTYESGKLYSGMDSCQWYDFTSPAVLLSVVGNGNSLVASPIGMDNFQARVSVYERGCTVMSCVPGLEHEGTVAWDTNDNEEYILAVHGEGGGSTNVGDFVLFVDSIKSGNLCDDAINVSPTATQGLVLTGSTEGLPLYQDLDECQCQSATRSPAAVYRLEGTGDRMMASLYQTHSGDESLSICVYTGLCNNVQCADTDRPSYRTVTWETNDSGDPYYLVVSSCCSVFSTAPYVFELSAFPVLDACTALDSATEITSETPLIFGSTTNSSFYGTLRDCSSHDEQQNIKSRVAVYKLAGIGELVTVHVQGYFETRLSVARGRCESLTCVEGDYGYERDSFKWQPEAGIIYYVLVYSDDPSEAGDFVLHAKATSSGDVCLDAIGLSKIPQTGLTVRRTTEEAKFYTNLGSCPYSSEFGCGDSAGIMLSVVGSSGFTTASVCQDGSDAFIVSVYDGSCDSQLRCIGTSSHYSQCVVTWESEEDALYYVFIQPCSENEALEFELSLSLRAIGDPCENAVPLVLTNDEVSVSGSTETDGMFYDLETCGYSSAELPGMLYSINGTGDIFTMEYSQDDYFGLRVFVYTGTCGVLRCFGDPESLTWKTNLGIIYYMYAVGCCDPEASGDFVLKVENTPISDACEVARNLGSIAENGTAFSASTSDYLILGTCEGDVEASGALFNVNGTGEVISVTVRDTPESTVSASLTVFEGICSPSSCVDGFLGGNARAFLSLQETTYAFLVYANSRAPVEVDFDMFVESLPPGDACEDAVPLGFVNQTIMISNSTKNGRFYFDLETCGYDAVGSPALVYKFMGTGDVIVPYLRRIGDGPSVHLSVYSGECPSLSCVSYEGEGLSAAVDEMYYIFIHGGSSLSSVGTFSLLLQTVPSGDVCKSVIPLGAVTETPTFYHGFTSNGHLYTELDCFHSRVESPAMAYEIQGSGDYLTISTGLHYSDGPSVMVFEGNCDDLTCVDGDYGEYRKSFTWLTELSKSYFVFVHDCCGATDTDEFTFAWTPRREGAVCTDTVPLSVSSNRTTAVFGSTTDGYYYLETDLCDATIQSPSIVYRMTGIGEILTASTLDDSSRSDFDARISVFRGECGDLRCVDTLPSDDGTSWLSERDEDYYVFVNGCCDHSTVGDFVLTISSAVTETPSAPGDVCQDSREVLLDIGSTTTEAGTTSSGHFYFNLDESCDYDKIDSRAVIYDLVGNGEYVVVKVKQDGLWDFDAQLAVFIGSCDSLHCLETTGARRDRAFPTEPGAHYYVALYDCCGRTGEFAVRFTSLPLGDPCLDSRDLGALSADWTMLSGTMQAAKRYLDPDTSCGYTVANFESPTSAYSFEGDGSIYSLRSSGDGVFSTELSIYGGACETNSNFFCVDHVGDWQDSAFVSQQSSRYYAFVSSHQGSVDSGDFNLQIVKIGRGDLCADAVEVGPVADHMVYSGSTRNGLYYGEGPCQNWVHSRGVLYAVEGTGAAYTASVCEWSEANFLSVFRGGCNSAECIGAHECKYTWITEPGEAYFVLIQSHSGGILGAGDFVLVLSSTEQGDFCRDSVPIVELSANTTELIGSTDDGKIYRQPSSCYGYGPIESPATVYSVSGDGDYFTAWVSSNYPGFHLSMYVDEPNCSNVTCLEGVSNTEDNFTWRSETGRTYFVLVGNADGAATGSYVLSLRKWYSGNVCDRFRDLDEVPEEGMVVTDSTESDGLFFDLPACRHYGVISPAIAYKLRGTGSSVTARIQDITSQLSAVIFVYEGPCESLVCVETDDYSSTSMAWLAAAETDYYVIAFGCCDPSRSGSYELRLTSSLTDGTCNDATNLGTVPAEGLRFEDSTERAIGFSELMSCHSYDELPSPGLLYKFTGNGTVLVSISSLDYGNARMVIYKGVCGSLGCVYARNDLESAIIETTLGDEVFVYVSSCCGPTAQTRFALDIQARESANICTDSEDLGTISSERDMVVVGSTVDSKFVHGVDSCQYEDIWAPVALYRFEGSGDLVLLDALSTNFNPMVTVLKGTACESGLECASDTQRGWYMTEPGLTYFVIVYGRLEGNPFGGQGDFVLRVSSITAGNLCVDAVSLEYPSQGGFSVSGSTDFGHFFYMNDCTYDGSESRAIAYQLMGTGERWNVYVSYKDHGAFDVLSGSCDSFECVNTDQLDGGAGKSWETELGVVYYLVIHNGNNARSSSDFYILFDRLGSGDTCSDTIDLGEMPVGGMTITGSTEDDGKLHLIATCVYPVESSLSVIYSLIGTGHMYFASVHGVNFGGAHLSLYNNTCDNMTCVDVEDNSVEWHAELGSTYFLVVHGCCDMSSRGDYYLRLGTSATPEPTTPEPTTTVPPTTISPSTISPSPEPTDASSDRQPFSPTAAALLALSCVGSILVSEM